MPSDKICKTVRQYSKTPVSAEEMKKLQKRYQKEKEQIHARFVAEREAVYCG